MLFGWMDQGESGLPLRKRGKKSVSGVQEILKGISPCYHALLLKSMENYNAIQARLLMAQTFQE